MTVSILMLLAAGDAVVISEIFCPRRCVGCCYRQGSNLLTFIIHSRLQQESSHVSIITAAAIKPVNLTLQDSLSLHGNWILAKCTISHTKEFSFVSVEACSAVSLQLSGFYKALDQHAVSQNSSVLLVF